MNPTSSSKISPFQTMGTVLCFGLVALTTSAHAHGISEASKTTMTEGGLLDYIWLGAEHMVTGYDHLLFLFGVIFFLSHFKDVVRFITAFTLGHCITLLGATMAGITANAYLIDAVIALSVIYKGFENLDGFKKIFKIEAPNLLTMVFIFGLIHGFGLSTRLQELTLGQEGLVSRIVAFNVGVEVGQIAALTVMLGVFAVWKKSSSFTTFSTAANAALVLAGTALFVMQVDGYMHEEDHHAHHDEPSHNDGHHHEDANTPPKTDTSTDTKTNEPDDAPPQPEAKENTIDGTEEHADEDGQPHSHGETTHSHGEKTHSHGEKTHSHGEKTHSHRESEESSPPAPAETDKPSHTHKHGSGKAHSH